MAMIMAALLAMQAMQGMEHAPANCPATPTPPPAELAGWTRPVAMKAGADGAQPAVLQIGTGATATLLPTPSVRYPLRPEKPGGSVSSGGVFAFTVAAPGRYRVALGSAAWIDLVSGSTALVSAAHGPGAACSGIRKMVDFDLKPGRYLLQIAGNGAPTLSLMVAKLPS